MPLLLPAELVQALAHCAVAIAAAAAEGAKRAVVQRILGDLRFIQDPLALVLQLPVLRSDLVDRLGRILPAVKADGQTDAGSPSQLPVDLPQPGPA